MTRNYTKQDVQNKLEKVQNKDYVSEHNAELLEEFIDYLRADHNVSTNRQYKYLTGFKTLFKKFIDFPLDDTSKREIRQTIGKIRGSEYSDHTKRDFKVYIKKFYNTYYEDEVDRPDWVKRILGAQFMKLNSNPSRQTEIEALTPEEIMSMVEAADKTRSKLLPLFLFETGARISEITGNNPSNTIKLKHIELKQKYAEVELHTLKNNKDNRKLQLTRCVGLLQKWLEEHPENDNPEAQLFVNIESSNTGVKGQGMSQEYISKILRRLAEKAEIDKPVFPHVFRHSSATHKNWPIDRLMYWHGWKDMDTASTYSHEDDERMRKARLAEEGINEEENTHDPTDRKECGRCGEDWPPNQKYCGNCSLALDKQVAKEVKEAEQGAENITKAQMQGITEQELKKIKQEVVEEMES